MASNLPTTPEKERRPPPLDNNGKYHNVAIPAQQKEQSNQYMTEKSPTTPTFSRAPTIDVPYDGHNEKPLGHHLDGSIGLIPGRRYVMGDGRPAGNIDNSEHISSETATSTSQWIRSIRWRGVLAIVAGMFSQMLCWGLINFYGTLLAFVSQRPLLPNNYTLSNIAGCKYDSPEMVSASLSLGSKLSGPEYSKNLIIWHLPDSSPITEPAGIVH